MKKLQSKIDKSKLFGVLNELDGTPIRRKVRVVKVGIGLPKGPDVHVWVDLEGKYALTVGEYPGRDERNVGTGKRAPKIKKFESMEELRLEYHKARNTAAIRPYPMKLPYFTFLRMGVTGDYVYDLVAIEKHGSMPTEIEIMFLMDDPLEAQFKWFTAAELKCEGNGVNAMRRNSLALTEKGLKMLRLYYNKDEIAVQVELATKAEADGEKFFEFDQCYTQDCPVAAKGSCKPHARLSFQLINAPVSIGGTSSFDTTGKRSITQLASCLDEVREATRHGFPPNGLVTGIPMMLVVRPYKTSHDGTPAVQYGVSLEVRGENAVALWRDMLSGAAEFRQLRTSRVPTPLALEAGSEEDIAAAERVMEEERAKAAEGEVTEISPDEAAGIEAEYYPTASNGEDSDDHMMVDHEVDEVADDEGAHVESESSEESSTRVAPINNLRDLTNSLKQRQGEKQNGETDQSDLFTESPPAISKTLHGIQFPADVVAGPKSSLLLSSMDSEAQRAGVDLVAFIEGLFQVKPIDLNEEAARSIVHVLRKYPDKGEREELIKAPLELAEDNAETSPTVEQQIANCKYTNEVKKLCNSLIGPASKLGDEEKRAIEKACIKRIEEIKEAKRTAANGAQEKQ